LVSHGLEFSIVRPEDRSFSIYPMEADGTLVDEIVPVLKILRDLHVRFLLLLVDGPVPAGPLRATALRRALTCFGASEIGRKKGPMGKAEARSPSRRRLYRRHATPFHESCLYNSIPQPMGQWRVGTRPAIPRWTSRVSGRDADQIAPIALSS